MIKDEFFYELQVTRLENSILLAASHLNELGYNSWHDSIYRTVVEINNRNLSLEEKYEQLLIVFNMLIDRECDDQDVNDVKELMVIRIEFPLNYHFYKNTGFFKGLRNGSVIERDHRICRLGEFGRIQRFYRDGVLGRGM